MFCFFTSGMTQADIKPTPTRYNMDSWPGCSDHIIPSSVWTLLVNSFTNASQIYNLRPRGHTHSLSSVKTTNFMKSFITKSLFNNK